MAAKEGDTIIVLKVSRLARSTQQSNVSELARVFHISRTTVYKYIGLLEA